MTFKVQICDEVSFAGLHVSFSSIGRHDFFALDWALLLDQRLTAKKSDHTSRSPKPFHTFI
jgi:hypothetical protein